MLTCTGTMVPICPLHAPPSALEENFSLGGLHPNQKHAKGYGKRNREVSWDSTGGEESLKCSHELGLAALF